MKHQFLILVVLVVNTSVLFAENLANDSMGIASQQKQEYREAIKYLRGIDTEIDMDKAKTLLFDLAKEDYAPALRTIGTMYSRGVGVKQNCRKAYIA